MTETCPAQVSSPALSHSRVWASNLGVGFCAALVELSGSLARLIEADV